MPDALTQDETMRLARQIATYPHRVSADDAVAVSRALLAAHEARPTWQPIETAPKDETYIGAHINERGVNEVRLCFGDWSRVLTHWMPLPAPPATGADDE